MDLRHPEFMVGRRPVAASGVLPLDRVVRPRAADTRTSSAEAGLGIAPPRSSFFVEAALPTYGQIVIVLDPSRADHIPFDVSPFDTGGLWYDYVTTEPVLDEAGKAPLVAEYSYSSDYEARFIGWRAAAFRNRQEYTRGATPGTKSVDRIPPSSNARHAWTWEARVHRRQYEYAPCTPVLIIMRSDDAESYFDWVRDDSPLQYDQRLAHLRSTKAILERNPDPSARAEEMLCR